MTLVVDSSVVIRAVAGSFALPDDELIAPMVLDSEVLAVLRRLEWGSLLDARAVERSLAALDAAPVARVEHSLLRDDALAVARALGWARTYDAEYVALARQRDAILVSADVKLRRGASRLVRTAAPEDV